MVYHPSPISFLGKMVNLTIDRPLGSRHPQHGFIYPVNYGFIPNTLAPDGEEIDAYVLGLFEPCQECSGRCIAVIVRAEEEDDKLVVSVGNHYSDAQIVALTEFQEQFYNIRILRE